MGCVFVSIEVDFTGCQIMYVGGILQAYGSRTAYLQQPEAPRIQGDPLFRGAFCLDLFRQPCGDGVR